MGTRHCIANAASVADTVVWPAAGIARAQVAGRLEVQICCFRAVEQAPLPVGKQTVLTYRESGTAGDDDEFPDLIEDDAHVRSVSIRGTLGDPSHPVRVDVLLKCSASKFADRFALQFTIVNRSGDPVEVDWDLLRETERRLPASAQPVAGGKAWVFLTTARPREALATVELKTRAGASLGRFQFDAWK